MTDGAPTRVTAFTSATLYRMLSRLARRRLPGGLSRRAHGAQPAPPENLARYRWRDAWVAAARQHPRQDGERP